MFDFSAYGYDFGTNRLLVDGEPMIFHCHHSLLSKLRPTDRVT
jgi:hypothetical protein